MKKLSEYDKMDLLVVISAEVILLLVLIANGIFTPGVFVCCSLFVAPFAEGWYRGTLENMYRKRILKERRKAHEQELIDNAREMMGFSRAGNEEYYEDRRESAPESYNRPETSKETYSGTESYKTYTEILDNEQTKRKLEELLEKFNNTADVFENMQIDQDFERFAEKVENAGDINEALAEFAGRFREFAYTWKRVASRQTEIAAKLKELFLAWFGSMAVQGYDGWTSETDNMQMLEQWSSVLDDMIDSCYAMMEMISRVEYLAAECRDAFPVLEDALENGKRTSACFADIVRVYKNFKKER